MKDATSIYPCAPHTHSYKYPDNSDIIAAAIIIQGLLATDNYHGTRLLYDVLSDDAIAILKQLKQKIQESKP